MAKYVSLPTVIESDAKQIFREYSTKRAYASLADGMHIVNRAILYALMNDFKGDKDFVSATNVCSKVKSSYHLHSDESIHRTASIMSGERLPLLRASKSTGRSDMRDGLTAQRYAQYYKTKWGQYVNSSLCNAHMVQNYSLSSRMPDYYPTMFPYMLFTNYSNINMGVTHNTLPMCPEEIFKMMLQLLDNENTPIEDMLPLFKGPDITSTYTIVGNPQSRYALLKDGYGKFDILTNLTFTRTEILLEDVPYRSQKTVLERVLQKCQLESMVLGTPMRTNSPKYVMSVPYTLIDGYTLEDARKELYEKTTLKKTIAVELVGFHPKDIDAPYAGKLDIVGIREMLMGCLNYGYAQRIKDVQNEIEEIKKGLFYDSLMERLTRPETLEWYKPIIDKDDKKAILLEKGNATILPRVFGKYIKIPGGITQSEVDYVFDRKGTPPNNNLDRRPEIIANLQHHDDELNRLYPELEHDTVLAHLKTVIEDWLQDAECARRSRILFTNGEDSISTVADDSEQILIKHIVTTKDDLALNVNLIFYKDGTADYWNPKHGEDIPEDLMSKEIHTLLKCTTNDTVLVMNTARRFKTKVKYLINNLTQFNQIYGDEGIFFQGVLIYEWNGTEPEEDDVLLMVTSRNRVKKMTVASILQKFETVKALPLYTGEYIKEIKLDKLAELDKCTLEVMTSRGIKRKRISETRIKNLKGFVTLVAYDFDRETVDFRLCKEDDKVMVLEDGVVREVPVDLDTTFKRDIYKEVIVDDEGKFNHYVTDKEYYSLDGKLADVKDVFSVDEAHTIANVLTVLPTNYVSVPVQHSKLRIQNKESEQ